MQTRQRARLLLRSIFTPICCRISARMQLVLAVCIQRGSFHRFVRAWLYIALTYFAVLHCFQVTENFYNLHFTKTFLSPIRTNWIRSLHFIALNRVCMLCSERKELANVLSVRHRVVTSSSFTFSCFICIVVLRPKSCPFQWAGLVCTRFENFFWSFGK